MPMRLSLILLILLLASNVSAQELILQTAHTGQVTRSVFSDDSKLLATVGDDRTLKVWNLESGRVQRTFQVDGAHCPAFLGHGELVALSAGQRILTFSLEDGREVGAWQLPESSRNPEIRARGDRVYSLGGDGTVRLWSASGEPQGSLELPFEGSVMALSQKHLAVAQGQQLVVLELQTKELVTQSTLASACQSLDFSPEGRRLLVGGEVVQVLDLQGREVERHQPEGTRTVALGADGIYQVNSWAGSAGFGPLGGANQIDRPMTHLNSGPEGELAIGGYEGELFHLKPGARQTEPLQGQVSGVYSAALDAGGQYLVTGSSQGNVKFWNLKEGRIERHFKGFDSAIGRVAISPDGQWVAASDAYEGVIRIWNRKSGELLSSHRLKNYRPFFGGGVTCMAFSPDGAVLAFGATTKTLNLLDPSSGRLKISHKTGISPRTLAFHPGGQLLAFAQKDEIQELAMLTHTVARTRKCQGRIWALSYSATGDRLAAGTYRNGVRVWQTNTAEDKGTKLFCPSAVLDLRFDATDRLLAACYDGRVRLWDRHLKGSDWQVHRGAVGWLGLAQGGWITRGDGIFRVWREQKLVASALEVNYGQDWVVTDPDGRFDGTSEGQRLLEWELGGRSYHLEQFFSAYFTPGLLAQVLESASSQVPRISENFKRPPEVNIVSPESGPADSAEVEVSFEVSDRGGGVSRVELAHNGHQLPAERIQRAAGDRYKAAVRLIEGKNELHLTAFNGDGSVRSRQARIRLLCAQAGRAPELHLLVVGVNRYQSGLALRYAVDDARAIAQLFQPGVFAKVHRHQLLDEQAGLKAIETKLGELATTTEPQDGLVVYMAGHGTVAQEMYYFLPHDARVNTDDELRATTLSTVRLAELLRQVPATKQMVILDTCRSGAAAAAAGRLFARRGGLEEVRAQQALARAAGTFLVAASTAQEFALESSRLGHGVLAYAIIQALSGDSRLNREGAVTANTLLESVSAAVPRLTEELHGQSQHVVQYSSGQDFPLMRFPSGAGGANQQGEVAPPGGLLKMILTGDLEGDDRHSTEVEGSARG